MKLTNLSQIITQTDRIFDSGQVAIEFARFQAIVGAKRLLEE